jgi:hypothetical protein
VTLAGTTLVAAAVSNTGSVFYFVLPQGGSSWGRTQITGPNDAVNNPSIAWSGSSVLVAWTAPDDSIQFKSHPFNGGWYPSSAPQEVSGPGTISGSPSLTWTNRGTFDLNGEFLTSAAYADVIYAGTDGSLNEKIEYAGTTNWYYDQIGGPNTVSGNPSVDQQGTSGSQGATLVAYTGLDGSLNFQYSWEPGCNFPYFNCSSQGWTGEQVAPPNSALPDPSIANTGTGATIAAEHSVGGLGLNFYWNANGSPTWNHQSVPVA